MSIPEQGMSPDQLHEPVDIDEAVRQLDLAAHDVAVASGCIALGDLNEAHTNAITARAAVDAAEEILRVAIIFRERGLPDLDWKDGNGQ